MLVKRKGGWKIKSHTSGKIYPKLYKSRKAGKRRIAQMMRYKNR